MPRFTEADVIEVWDRWQAGDANRLIGRDLGRSAELIRAFVESWGGVRPETRRRSPRHLSLVEREEISRGVAAGDSLRMVAVRLGRAPSTISRELNRTYTTLARCGASLGGVLDATRPWPAGWISTRKNYVRKLPLIM